LAGRMIQRKKPIPSMPTPRFAKVENLIFDEGKVGAYWEKMVDLVSRYGPTTSSYSLKTKEGIRSPRAWINPAGWDITVVVDPRMVLPKDRELLGFLEKMGIEDPFLELIRDITIHEIGHWEYPRGSGSGCPMDGFVHHRDFVEPAYEELKKSGRFTEGQSHARAYGMANAVEDIIDNHNVFFRGGGETIGCGQMLFWYMQGQINGNFGKEYSLFVKLNLMNSPNRKAAERLLKRFFCKTARREVGEAASRLSKVFTPKNIQDRSKWEELARAYTQEAAVLLEEDKKDHSKSANKEGEGSSGPTDSETEEEPKEEEAASSPTDSKTREDPFKKLSKRDIERLMGGRGENGEKGRPFYLDAYTALDGLYNSLSRRIKLKARKAQSKGAMHPAVAVSRREYDPERDMGSSCEVSRLKFSIERRAMVPTVATYHHKLEMPIRKTLRDFPPVAYSVVDASPSMVGAGNRNIVPWGDKSGYHYALLAFYGIIRQVEKLGLMGKVDFMGTTFARKSNSARGLEKTKRLLLSKPSMYGTELDIGMMEAMLGKRKGVLFPLISDGEIFNWEKVRGRFMAIARKQQFFMVQIGGETGTSRELKRAGFVVKNVNSYEDVVSLVVDLTAERYLQEIERKVATERVKMRG